MSAVVIEHVKVSELPENWRIRLCAAADARVTVRIEEEAEPRNMNTANGDNPLFGMWHDREEMVDVRTYVRRIRAPRF